MGGDSNPQLGVIDGTLFNTTPPVGWYVCNEVVLNVPNYGRELGRSNYLGVGGAFGQVQPGDPTHAQVWVQYTGIYYANSKTLARHRHHRRPLEHNGLR